MLLYDIVSSLFAVIFAFKKSEIPPSTLSWCPVKSQKWGWGHCDPCFMGKAQKWGFSCFSEQILAKFVLCAIYFDESHVPSHLSKPPGVTTTQIHILITKMTKTLDFDDFWQFSLFLTSVMTSVTVTSCTSIVRGDPSCTQFISVACFTNLGGGHSDTPW